MAAKAKKSQAPEIVPGMLDSMQNWMKLTSGAKMPAEQFWSASEKLLRETEDYTRRWFERRHEAARSALETARQSVNSGAETPADAFQRMAEWQRHSVERMVDDAQEWLDTVARCARCVVEVESGVMEETLEEVTKGARKSASSAKSDPV